MTTLRVFGTWLWLFALLPAADGPRVVFVIGEDEYRTAETLPEFSRAELEPRGFRCSYSIEDPSKKNIFPGMEALKDADLLILSTRRRTPTREAMAQIRAHLNAGKPLVAIKTASHGFQAEPPEGHEAWNDFDREVLGHHYANHYSNHPERGDPPTVVRVVDGAKAHPVLTGVEAQERKVWSWLYKVEELSPTAQVLLEGQIDGKSERAPVALTNSYKGGRVFYTSLGHPWEFRFPWFRKLLVNAVFWTLGRDVPAALQETPGVKAPMPASELAVFEGTKLLSMQGDIASELVAGVDRFLLREIAESEAKRERHWKRDFSSPEAYVKSVEPNRKRLAHILGVRDTRLASHSWWRLPRPPRDLAKETGKVDSVKRDSVTASYVRWPAFGAVSGEGLLLTSFSVFPPKLVIAIPDADQTPEQIAGLAPGVPPELQFARRLAKSGCTVLVPSVISRQLTQRRNATLTHREFLYRPAFELGRQLLGYEVQMVLAAVDMLKQEDLDAPNRPIGVVGYGEGGFIALAAAALDPRINVTLVSGFFDDRRNVWKEPIDRNVFGPLDHFADAELASLIAPRTLIVEASKGPELTLLGKGGAPARLVTPECEDLRREVERARKLTAGLNPVPKLELIESGDGTGPAMSEPALEAFLKAHSVGPKLAPVGELPPASDPDDAKPRLDRQIREIDRHNQDLLAESPYVRAEFMKNLDTKSLEAYKKSTESYRKFFSEEVIGRFENPRLPLNPRTRLAYDEPAWRGYEVMLDVFPDVFAYGILLVPKDLKPGERRPAVVCQHGLEGRPQHVIGQESFQYYKAFAADLCKRGFITFAPQNLYIFQDRFRTLQRKANPLGKTLFSIIVPQHEAIVEWLGSLAFIDRERIGFYGLSYGGKTAMRVPALVTGYALSICSADFNEWVWKNASTRSPYSYVWTGEYEIFEFDLGSTFNYAEMAALIAPRPFMVERGHFDGVAPDEAVGYEYAKVRHLYAARLGIGDRTEIEWFVGPHSINGQATYRFLHRHLRWPEK